MKYIKDSLHVFAGGRPQDIVLVAKLARQPGKKGETLTSSLKLKCLPG